MIVHFNAPGTGARANAPSPIILGNGRGHIVELANRRNYKVATREDGSLQVTHTGETAYLNLECLVRAGTSGYRLSATADVDARGEGKWRDVSMWYFWNVGTRREWGDLDLDARSLDTHSVLCEVESFLRGFFHKGFGDALEAELDVSTHGRGLAFLLRGALDARLAKDDAAPWHEAVRELVR